MFQFPALALSCESDGCFHPPGCPIRTSRDQSPRAAPPGFSQLATSFLACPRLGILRAPLLRLTRSNPSAGAGTRATGAPQDATAPPAFPRRSIDRPT